MILQTLLVFSLLSAYEFVNPSKWSLVNPKTNDVCILLECSASFSIEYKKTDESSNTIELIVPEDATVDASNSFCELDADEAFQKMTLSFSGNALEIIFLKKNSKTMINSIIFKYNVTEDLFPGHPQLGQCLTTAATKLKLFETSVYQSYICENKQTLKHFNDTDISLKFFEIHFEIFRETNSKNFNEPLIRCPKKMTDFNKIIVFVGIGVTVVTCGILIFYIIKNR